MNKKIFITFLLISLFLMFTCSYSFANTDAGNMVMDAGNNIGNTVAGATNTVVNGTRNIVNGIANLANDATNANGDTENDATNTNEDTGSMLNNNNDNYTATRTATNNMLGMTTNTWTWLILGIVGAVIVALVWYYGKQYEHRNYNND